MRRSRDPGFGPLDFISLRNNENKMPPMLVLCRAPADDGWICIEGETAVIYNLFDTVAHKYEPYATTKPGIPHPDFRTRAARAALLSRATWYHRPARYETVGSPRIPRSARSAA